MEWNSVTFEPPGSPPLTQKPRTARELALALALKACLLTALYLLFFGPAHRPPTSPAATAAALIGPGVHEDQR